MMTMIALVTLIIIIAGGLFAYYVSRGIANPIISLTGISKAVALGETSLEITHISKDEPGLLADAFRAMLDNFKGKAAASEEISKGNLDIKFPVASDNDTMGLAMRHMRITITEMVSMIQEIASRSAEGDLKVRGDAGKFQGGFSGIITSLNQTLDAIVTPVNEAMRLSDSYAKGNYIDRVNEQFSVKGDFIPFKKALNEIGIQGSSAIVI
jgi:methyl-accepting chemotaxis protein